MVRTDERDRVISIGDWANCLFALIRSDEGERENLKAFVELAGFTDGRKRNIGYSMFYGLLEMYNNDFIKAQQHLARMLNIDLCGLALPVSTQPTHLLFETKNGNQYQGEHELDVYQMSQDEVVRAWIEPEVSATEEALRVIEAADYLIYCPGSLYGSLVANFLPQGMRQALANSHAKKILIPNLVSDRNQTHNFNIRKYYETLSSYTGLDVPFEVVIVPNISKNTFEQEYWEIAQRYADEYSYMLEMDSEPEWLEANPQVIVVKSEIMMITPHKRLRHDPATLAKLWMEILN